MSRKGTDRGASKAANTRVPGKGRKRMVDQDGEAMKPLARPFANPAHYHEEVREVPYVTVIGAGVTGLTVAQELAERGFGVQVVEPAIGRDGNLDIGGLAATQYARPQVDEPCDGTPGPKARAGSLERTTPPLAPDIDLSIVRRTDDDDAQAAEGLVWDPREEVFAVSEGGSRRLAGAAMSALADTIEQWQRSADFRRTDRPTVRLLVRPRVSRSFGPRDRRAAHLAVAHLCVERLDAALRAYQRSGLPTDHDILVVYGRETAEVRRGFLLRGRGPVQEQDIVEPQAEVAEARARVDLGEPGDGPEQGAPEPAAAATLYIDIALPTDFDCICDSGVVIGPERLEWVPGEHGYRFFPSFYRHIFDTMRRTPVFDADGEITHRSTYDNLVPTVVQGIAYEGPDRRFVRIRRDRPGSFEDFRELQRDLYDEQGLRFTEADMARYQLELFRYMTASSARREAWSQDPDTATWWDFVGAEAEVPVGPPDPFTGDRARADRYTDAFREHLKVTSLALVAMDEKEIDTRTYGNIGVQLLLDQVAMGGQTDMTLNGPTSQAWFRHWKTYLERVGVRFYKARLTGIYPTPVQPVGTHAPPPLADPWTHAWPAWGDDFGKHQRMEHLSDLPPGLPPHDGGNVSPTLPTDPRGIGTLPEPDGHDFVFNHYDPCGDEAVGSVFDPDYYVVAMPLDRLWRVLDAVADPKAAFPAGTPMGDLYRWLQYVRNEDFGTNVDPTKAAIRYDKTNPWYEDQGRHGPFRHFSGIQYYFDADFQYHPGHTYFPDADWGLSSISQAQFWHGVRIWQTGFRGVLSVDIGDMTAADADGRNVWAHTTNGIALEAWEQMTDAVDIFLDDRAPPLPRHYHLDAHLLFSTAEDLGATPPLGEGWLLRNSAPFLINRPPIWKAGIGGLVLEWDEWAQRPGTLLSAESTADGHIGRKHIDLGVSWGRWIVAGPHTKTFTRLTTMEAANESARHAVNTLLAHLARLDETADRRSQEDTPPFTPYLGYRSAGLLMGDFASTWDLEDNEIPDLAFWKRVDEKLVAQGLPHMVEILDLHRKLDDWLDTVDQLRDDAILAGLVAQTASEDWTDLPGLLVPGVADLLSKIVKPT